MRKPLLLLPLLLILCFLLLASFANAKSYRVEVTEVRLMDCHRAIVRGQVDASPTARAMLRLSGESWWSGDDSRAFVDDQGGFTAQLKLRGLLTTFDVAVLDGDTQLTGTASPDYYYIGGLPYVKAVLSEFGGYFILALALFIITAFAAVSSGYSSRRFGNWVWLLALPFAGLPFLLQKRYAQAWLFQVLQWLLVSYNLLLDSLDDRLDNIEMKLFYYGIYAFFWWAGWIIGLVWGLRSGAPDVDRRLPERRWAWASVLLQLVVRWLPGLGQLLQGRPARACLFLGAQMVLVWAALAYDWFRMLTGPNFYPISEFFRNGWFYPSAVRLYGGLFLLLACLAEAAWFAWRATRSSKPSLAEQEAKAG